MVNFYIYYNIYTHIDTYIHIYIYIYIKNIGKLETVHRYWLVPKYIVPLIKLVQPPIWHWPPWSWIKRPKEAIEGEDSFIAFITISISPSKIAELMPISRENFKALPTARAPSTTIEWERETWNTMIWAD